MPRITKTLWELPLEPGAKPRTLLKNGFDVDEPQISPDGRWLSYASDDSGGWEVYIQAYGRPGGRVRASTDGGGQPRWRRDGKELFYLARDGRLMAVTVRGGAAGVEVDLPSALFDTGGFRARLRRLRAVGGRAALSRQGPGGDGSAAHPDPPRLAVRPRRLLFRGALRGLRARAACGHVGPSGADRRGQPSNRSHSVRSKSPCLLAKNQTESSGCDFYNQENRKRDQEN